MDVENKRIAIVGGGSGIGLSLAKMLVSHSAQVIICGRNNDRLQQAQKQVPNLIIKTCDVTSDKDVIAFFEFTQSLGGIDILVNSAAIFHYFDYLQGSHSTSDQIREIDINLGGTVRMVDKFLPSLLKRKEAAIVNITTGLSFVPMAYSAIYSASKAALHAWTQCLRWQLRESSVKVFELIPPLVDTALSADFKHLDLMDPDQLAVTFMKHFKKDKLEIVVGQSKQLRLMSRLAPGFIFKQLNKGIAGN